MAMSNERRWLLLYSVVSVLSLVGFRHAELVPTAHPVPDRFVAEATIQSVHLGRQLIDSKVLLPVTLHGQVMTTILDLGGEAGLFGVDVTNGPMESGIPTAALRLGPDSHTRLLDSLTLGTVVEHDVPVFLGAGTTYMPDLPAGLPPLLGYLGTYVLSHYDLVFDGPAHRVRLYTFAGSAAMRRSAWLPPGIARADCTLMGELDSTKFVRPPIWAKGHPIDGVFDSGAGTTSMNLTAAHLLGITPTSPHVQIVSADSATYFFSGGNGGDTVYRVTGLTFTVGSRRLRSIPVTIYSSLPGDHGQPKINLGLDAFRDRVLVVSYSTGHVCVGEPR